MSGEFNDNFEEFEDEGFDEVGEFDEDEQFDDEQFEEDDDNFEEADFEEDEQEFEEDYEDDKKDEYDLKSNMKSSPSLVWGDEKPGSPSNLKRTVVSRGYSREEVRVAKEVIEKRKRAKKILERITLSISNEFTLCTMYPKTAYELHLRKKNIKSSSIQCPPENELIDVGSVTEEIEKNPCSAQVPEELYGLPVEFKTSEMLEKKKYEDEKINTQQIFGLLKPHLQFLEKILEQKEKTEEHKKLTEGKDSKYEFSKCYYQVFKSALCRGRRVTCVQYDWKNNNNIFVSYSKSVIPDKTFVSAKGLICKWNIFRNYPERILACEGEITCFTQIAGKPNLIVGGTSNGSLVLWDLNEYEDFHIKIKGKAVRYPSYTTEWMINEIHEHSIIDIKSIGYKANEKNNQLISLDEFGNVIYWLVTNVISNNEKDDYGLKLNSSSMLKKNNSHKFKARCFSLENEVLNSSNFIVGADTGAIIRQNRFGHLNAPRKYVQRSYTSVNYVNCISYSPLLKSFFVCGCTDGSVKLYSTDFDQPINTFSSFTKAPIVDITWSNVNPSVFFVLDAFAGVFIFDLTLPDIKQMFKTQVYHEIGAEKKRKIGAKKLFTPFKTPGNNVTNNSFGLGFDDGTVEIHIVNEKLSVDEKKEKNVEDVKKEILSFFV